MTITKGKVTEIIIKVDDSFLEQAKLKGMESEYELIRCKDCIKKPFCTIYLETNADYGYCFMAGRRKENG